MKRLAMVLCALVMVFGVVGSASATVYGFEDRIDTWGPFNADAAWIGQNCPLSYTHDITDDVNFSGGDIVTEAYLELDFTNDLTDGTRFFGLVRWDYREFASYAVDEAGAVYMGEVDNENFSGLYLNVDWLNDDGLLDVTVSVSNDLGTATAWLDHSRVYGTAETAPVPEPSTILLMGVGLLALGYSRKRFLKKRGN
jgi:hypothetical protein